MPFVNQYKELITTKENVIFPFPDVAMAPAGLALFTTKLSQYPKIVCELGSGSGAHLIEQACRNPDTLFIGFELRYKRIFRTAEKAEQRGVSNMLLFRTWAQRLTEFFPAQSLDGVYVNFPDPWEKRRWKKHRLLSDKFIEEIASRLKPEGFLSYKTDHPEYFDEVVPALERGGLFRIEQYSRDLHGSEYASYNIFTEFEKLFLFKKLAILSVLARRVSQSKI